MPARQWVCSRRSHRAGCEEWRNVVPALLESRQRLRAHEDGAFVLVQERRRDVLLVDSQTFTLALLIQFLQVSRRGGRKPAFAGHVPQISIWHGIERSEHGVHSIGVGMIGE